VRAKLIGCILKITQQRIDVVLGTRLIEAFLDEHHFKATAESDRVSFNSLKDEPGLTVTQSGGLSRGAHCDKGKREQD
jgi:hypothetical protein